MLKYISWIVIVFVVSIALAILRKSVSTTFKCEYGCKSLKRKLQAFASFFCASLFAVCMVFINFGAIREYLFSILPEQTISSAYLIIKVLFGVPSVSYALNSLCIYFVIGSSISAVCVITVFVSTRMLLLGLNADETTTENEYNSVKKQSFFNRISFISLRRIRI